MVQYNEVKTFIVTNHCSPSKHRIEKHLMLNFTKHHRKLLNAGKTKADRIEKFNEMLTLAEKYRRKNQYLYSLEWYV